MGTDGGFWEGRRVVYFYHDRLSEIEGSLKKTHHELFLIEDACAANRAFICDGRRLYTPPPSLITTPLLQLSTSTPPTMLRNLACECQETERVVERERGEEEEEEVGGVIRSIDLPKLIPREHSVLWCPLRLGMLDFTPIPPRTSTHTRTSW